ncbi:MAG: heparan-alpha-glucosaminide N-acetyltransferase [Candidatus Aenigmatarchaeota archaeon]
MVKKRFWKNVLGTESNNHISYPRRFWEIDSIRGIAIISMIIFHFAFDLNYFTGNLAFGQLFWYVFPRAIASIFIIIAGISLSLSRNKPEWTGKKLIIRGAMIFSFGLLITLITALTLPRGTIFFGILHFIGLSTIISLPFLKMRGKNLIFGILSIMIGIYLQGVVAASPWLLWLGIMPQNFYTFDYFPLFPWFGLILIGIWMGNTLYPNSERGFAIKDLSRNFTIKRLVFIGRNSLMIYLIHQPLIILLLLLLGVAV